MTSTESKYVLCHGTRIYLLAEYLDDNQRKSLTYALRNEKYAQGVCRMPAVAQELWEYIGPKISSQVFFDAKRNRHFKVVNISEYITVTNNPQATPIHKDMIVNPRDHFKIAFYLNSVSGGGGTIFYECDERPQEDMPGIVVQNNPGSGVMFDLSLYHAGQSFTSG